MRIPDIPASMIINKINILKKYLALLSFIFLILNLFQIYKSNKPLYLSKFDKNIAYQDYYQSQWVKPNSKNPISDSDLYQVAGYELVTTGIHYKINPEVPPLGKLIIGYSILIFGNGYISSYISLLLSLLLFYFLTKYFFKNFFLRLFSVLLLSLDPLFVSFSKETLLDQYLLIALFLHAIFLFKTLYSTCKKSYMYATFSGLAFGAFMAIKIGILGIVPLGIHLFLIIKSNKLKTILPFTISAILIYLGSYMSFFINGENIWQLAKNHKWMLSFYADSTVIPVYGAVFASLLTGYIKGWHEGAIWTRISEWSILWPIYTILYVYFVVRLKFNKIKPEIIYITILTSSLITMYIFMPFFARYLLLIIPKFIIISILSFISFNKYNQPKIEKSIDHTK